MTAVLKRDYVLIMDKSGSMATCDVNGKSRWDAAQEGTLALAAKITTLDPDGIDVYFFNGGFKRYEGVTGDKVANLFQENEPQGGTDLGKVLQDAFSHFQLHHKPTTILVVTDGEPTDRASVKKAIIDVSKTMEVDEELAVQFIQIGQDKGAAEFLRSLDDDLVGQGAKFDIVDTVSQEEADNTPFNDLLLKAITD